MVHLILFQLPRNGDSCVVKGLCPMHIREDAGIFMSSVDENACLHYFLGVTTKVESQPVSAGKWQVKQTFF